MDSRVSVCPALVQGTYHMQTVAFNNWFVYCQNNEEGNTRMWEGEPGPQGQFQFIENEDGTFLMKTVEWPDHYVYMQNVEDGNIRMWKGDPGPQGHWIVERVIGHEQVCFVMKPKHWEGGRYM